MASAIINALQQLTTSTELLYKESCIALGLQVDTLRPVYRDCPIKAPAGKQKGNGPHEDSFWLRLLLTMYRAMPHFRRWNWQVAD